MSPRRSLVPFLASAVFLTAAPTAADAQHQWVAAGAGSWHVGANWSTGTVPTAASGVLIEGGPPQVSAAGACSTVDVGGFGGSGSLEINAGGTLTCTEVRVADNVGGNTGNLTVQGGGNLTVNGFFNTGRAGTATITVTGAGSRIAASGQITLGNGFGGAPSAATMNVLAGGAVTAGGVELGLSGATSTVNIGTGATVDANITSRGSGPSTVNFNHTDSITFARTISAFTLNKSGTGALTLTGIVNANTTVSDGSLLVNGTHASPVTVTGGVLGGTGTVGSITASGGTVSPGLSPGILTSGAVSLGAASTYFVELNGPVVGTGYDQLNVTGGVSLGGATLSGTAGAAHAPGTTFVIINNQSAGAVSGTFAGLPEASLVSLSGQTFAISYTGGDGNDVTLTAGTTVPSIPVFGMLIFVALLGGAGYFRLRAGTM